VGEPPGPARAPSAPLLAGGRLTRPHYAPLRRRRGATAAAAAPEPWGPAAAAAAAPGGAPGAPPRAPPCPALSTGISRSGFQPGGGAPRGGGPAPDAGAGPPAAAAAPAPPGAAKVGVLLLNLGGPEKLEDVQPFLYNLFADPDIIRLPPGVRFLQPLLASVIAGLRAPKSAEGYEAIGGGSPLRRITDEQAAAIREALRSKGLPNAEVRRPRGARFCGGAGGLDLPAARGCAPRVGCALPPAAAGPATVCSRSGGAAAAAAQPPPRPAPRATPLTPPPPPHPPPPRCTSPCATGTPTPRRRWSRSCGTASPSW
jgi:hypothetical protein